MVLVAVVLWGLSAAVTLLALAWVVREWVWAPWTLIACCKSQGIPGFPFVPFLGQMPAIDQVLRGEQGDRLRAVSRCYERHGSTFYFTVGRTVRLSIADPPLIKDILIANSASYSKPLHIRALGVLRDGVFASSGSIWAPQRELFNGPFHSKEVKSKIPTMIACARSAVDRWVAELDDGCGELDMYQKFAELTLDVIGRAAFGVETEGAATSVIQSFERYLFACRELVFGPPAAFPATLYSIRRKYRVSKDAAAEAHWLRTYMRRIIADRRTATPDSRHDLLDVVVNAVDNGQSNPRATHPDLTIGEKRKRVAELTRLTESQLLANSLTFLLAGHETTASLLTWTIYLLALHPLWQERARAEVEEFCPDGVVEPQVLNHLKLLGMILFESLRLFPPVPLIGRTALKENKVGPSLLIPEGLEVVIPVAILHRDKSIWGENADEFFPARFGNGISGACGSPLAFIPFGAGPRTCLGQTLALSEAKAMLAVMLPLFRWRLSPAYRHSPDVALAMVPEFGMQVVMERLEKSENVNYT